MVCDNCGTQPVGNAKFCHSCGCSLAAVPVAQSVSVRPPSQAGGLIILYAVLLFLAAGAMAVRAYQENAPRWGIDYSHPTRGPNGYVEYPTTSIQPDTNKVMALGFAATLFTLTGIVLALKKKAALPLAWVSFGFSVILVLITQLAILVGVSCLLQLWGAIWLSGRKNLLSP